MEKRDYLIKKLERQATESASERYPLYQKVNLKDAKLVLDVGCGTGAVLKEIASLTKAKIIGIDSSPEMIQIAKEALADFENVELRVGDAHQLSFKSNTFDLTTCNLLLMWTKNPQAVVREMARVTRADGFVFASLEPDYGGEIRWPENKKVDPIFAGKAIKKRGGDPLIGRKLQMLFTRAGLRTEMGISNLQLWSCEQYKNRYLSFREGYKQALKDNGLSLKEINNWEKRYLRALDEGIAMEFFPQFYAIGKKLKPS
jgi:SAM-dependent methyltransferase